MKNQVLFPWLLFSLILLLSSSITGQTSADLSWWKPSNATFPVIDGGGWSAELKDTIQRLPGRAKSLVRPPVWNLSLQPAGLFIRFFSNAPQIKVRYQIVGSPGMPHMPATGVSGVDLYAIDSDGTWHFCAGKYSFKDTVEYNFDKLKPTDGYHKLGREYRLYLPLYKGLSGLEIGVPSDSKFTPLPNMQEKPIVVYGTSIAQGACASRPGMAWTNILSRKLDRPVINLGFSGNGRLEPEIIDLINEIDAKVYVLDCLPNMTTERFSAPDLQKRIIEAVRSIRAKHPKTPILLTEHAGYSEGFMVPTRQTFYQEANLSLQTAVDQLKLDRVPALYTLTFADINFDLDATVDGTHPNDYGMMLQAQAYEKKLRDILREPYGALVTQKPIRQSREPGSYNWEERHNAIKTLNSTEPSKILFIGNSITHNWGGKPLNDRIKGADSWAKYLEPLQVRNLGFGWDRIENVLWRVYHDELEGIAPEKIVINIGTNNLLINTDEEIIEGLVFLIEAIKTRQPFASVYVLGLYPRREREARILKLNQGIQTMAKSNAVTYANIGSTLLLPTGKIDEKLFSDGLHPNAEGYQILGKALSATLNPVKK
ncbi:MAG TPA: SGNH/GDSL hydrolase family protein [Haliscomenobacter sp.]|uniref:SGNH/GDSL hydrolase family protein n=1 Tax=Haliscomenobacter sp. TaxID=2717303 RepID=UPI002BBE23A8|nr:SGNH/GDSL hydrolase family protein [Haliscomenobacter sp.]HOY15907.1 SGNH/GDSL hydrolase family protein [Haliscomenobacter sp.]